MEFKEVTVLYSITYALPSVFSGKAYCEVCYQGM